MAMKSWGGLLAAGLLWACGGQVEVIDDGEGSGGAGGGTLSPRTCDIQAGDVDLVPTRDSPEEACQTQACTVFFGHGQHLTCPGWGQTGTWKAGCTIWDCHCTDHETGSFSADFESGLVVDERDPAVTCRYVMVPRDES